MIATAVQPEVTGVTNFEDLIEHHQHEIFVFIYRVTGNRSEAEDLCQETFLRAFLAFDRLSEESNHRAWLYRIARNTTINYIRRQVRLLRIIDVLSTRESAILQDDYAEQAVDHDLLSRVQRAIEELPEKQRLALCQRKFGGVSYGEIARTLQCSEDSARANVYQAIRKLRSQFADELIEAGICAD